MADKKDQKRIIIDRRRTITTLSDDEQEKEKSEIMAICIGIIYPINTENKLAFKIKDPYVTLAFYPTKEQISKAINLSILGERIPMRYTGYGNDGKTECISVEIANEKIKKQSVIDFINELGVDNMNFIVSVDDEERFKKITSGKTPCSTDMECNLKIPYRQYKSETEEELKNHIFYGKLCFYKSNFERTSFYAPDPFFPPLRTYM